VAATTASLKPKPDPLPADTHTHTHERKVRADRRRARSKRNHKHNTAAESASRSARDAERVQDADSCEYTAEIGHPCGCLMRQRELAALLLLHSFFLFYWARV